MITFTATNKTELAMKKLFTYRRSIRMKMISSLMNSISECYIKRYLSYSLPNGSCNTISSPFYFRVPLVIR